MRVLVVEDDDVAAEHVQDALAEIGHEVVVVSDGDAALDQGARGGFDVLIIDRMLPGLDGLSLLSALRARGVDAPALFVTAMGAVSDRVAGLEAGGDDYLVKPFALAELKARVQALGRRSLNTRPATLLQFRDLTVDRVLREARRGDRRLDLLPLEFRLLEYLMLAMGQTVTRKMLLEQVWGFRFDPHTNIVETHISRLRAKLDQGDAEPIIRTIRGAGYLVGG
ncbi:MAG: response regulator transcription factor [bacterium]|nr:response regulator transcription factor [bacterium]